MIQKCQGGNRHQGIHHYTESAAPGSEQCPHFLFMCIARRGTVTEGTGPAHPVDDASCHTGQYQYDVEIAEIENIVGIDETFSRNTVVQGGNKFIRPAETVNEICNYYKIHRVAQQTQHTIRDHDGDLSADKDDRKCQRNTEEDDQHISGNSYSENLKM